MTPMRSQCATQIDGRGCAHHDEAEQFFIVLVRRVMARQGIGVLGKSDVQCVPVFGAQTALGFWQDHGFFQCHVCQIEIEVFLKCFFKRGTAFGPQQRTGPQQVLQVAGGFSLCLGRYSASLPAPKAQAFQRLSNKALAMTLTELSAMAPPAITGFR